MTDRELLEAAAKAAGITLTWGGKFNVGVDIVDCTDVSYSNSGESDVAPEYWNPLEDDGDALRLAVKLGIDLSFYGVTERYIPDAGQVTAMNSQEGLSPDPYAATRRAIVRAAAEIGSQQ